MANADENSTLDIEATKEVTKKTRRSSRLRAKNCSLQTLEPTPRQFRRNKAQKTDKNSRKASKKLNAGNKPNGGKVQSFNIRRVTCSPAATKSKRGPPAVVTPKTTEVKRSNGVRFNLGRNSIAEFNKENPPNEVERLTNNEVEREDQVHLIAQSTIDDDDDGDDETTRRNEEILAEWEPSFEELGPVHS